MAGKTFSVTAILGVNSSRMAKGLKGAARRMTTWAKQTMARVAALIKAGMMIAGAAVGVFATRSVKHFASFEKGMQEVFTLLPGISKAAMAEMETDVLKLAAKMGILPDEVVPALYQALSAGVPKANVFQFLEVASKSAMGGVATLTEAVDVLSSVTNAYGPTNLSAADAADILFTTVQAGKTNFAQLNASLYNVVPAAAAAGVSFEQVGAAVALLTSKGTPTSVATTQIRAAILSMFAPNKAMVKAFEASGMSVENLGKIMKTGQILPALDMVMKAANGDTTALKKMFGSVEALQAALQITGNQGLDFAAKLELLEARAGANQTAFEGMDKGLSRSWERIASAMRIAMIKMGKALSPFVQAAVPTILRIIEMIEQIPWTKIMQGFSRVWLVGIRPWLQALARTLLALPWGNLLITLLPVANVIIKTFQNLIRIAIGLAPALVPGIGVIANIFVLIYRKFFLLIALMAALAPSLGKIWKAVFEIMRTAFLFFLWPTQQNFAAFVQFTKSKLKEIWKEVRKFATEIYTLVETQVKKFWPMIKNVFNALMIELGKFFNEIKDKIPGLNEALDMFAEGWKVLKEELKTVWEELKAALQGFGEGMAEGSRFSQDLKDSLTLLFREVLSLVPAVVKLVVSFMKFAGVVAAVVTQLFGFQDTAKSGNTMLNILVGAAWILIDALRVLVQGILGGINAIRGGFEILSAFKDIWIETAILIRAFASTLREEIGAAFSWLGTTIDNILTIFQAMWQQLKEDAGKVWEALKKVFTDFKDFIYHILFGGTVTKDFKKAFDYISDVVMKVLDKIQSVFKTVFDGVKMGLDGLQKVFKTFGDFVNGIFDKILSVGGKAMDLAKGVIKAASGVFGGIMDKVTGGGGGGKEGGGNARPARGASELSVKNQVAMLNTSLKPIVEKLTSMDGSLKSIDKTLQGKFVNQ